LSEEYRIRARLSHVSLRVPDPERVARFYADVVGLSLAAATDDDRIRLGMGIGAHALELTEGDGLDHFALELADAAAVEDLAARAEQQGFAVERPAIDEDHPDAVRIHDPDGTAIELHGPVDHRAEHLADPGRRPVRIDHVTMGSADVAAMVDFYVSVLGFRVSDRMGDVFVWMRSGHQHHSVAVVQAERPGLDHYAYEVGDWDDLKTWCDELAARDVPLTWGPGRHGPGNNLFIMFDDSAANRIELSCEMERFWDETATYSPRRWRQGTKTINLWGVAPSWRDRVAG
jgi:catechol-2,3-dioxygenase